MDRTRFWAAPDICRALSTEANDAVYGLKLFADGALGSRTAAVYEPYADSGELGRMMYSNAGLREALNECIAIGKPIAIHAIGDRAIDEVVSLLHALGPALRAVPEIRIEHAQLISPATAREARRLGVKLSMQPNFSEDSIDYADRLGPARSAMNNPFRMLIDDVGYVPGVDLLFGSDGMPHGVAAALRAALFPPYEQQSLTVDEFVQGYCFPPGSPGSIAVEISGRDIVYSVLPVERTRTCSST
ncbi:MAG TPA: amidohydrolase family protein, partial [Tepidisphaeraceae bacterium]|jgi:predicted amidohydrolase YtcJ